MRTIYRDRLATHKVPCGWEFGDDLRCSALGKVLRHDL
jgi:hypothetical protein